MQCTSMFMCILCCTVTVSAALVVPMSYVAVWGIIEVVQDLRPGLLCIHLANTCQPEEGVCMLTACSILMLYMGGSNGSQCGTHFDCLSVGMPLRLSLDEPLRAHTQTHTLRWIMMSHRKGCIVALWLTVHNSRARKCCAQGTLVL